MLMSTSALSMVMFMAISTVWLYRGIKKGTRQLAATIAMCDASEVFMNWACRNPGVYIGLSPEGRRLLIDYIEKYEEWLVSHNTKDKEPHDMPPGIPKKPCDHVAGLFKRSHLLWEQTPPNEGSDHDHYNYAETRQ